MVSFSIDVGNSRTKIGLFKGRNLLKVFYFKTSNPPTSDSFSEIEAEVAMVSSVLKNEETMEILQFFRKKILLLDENCRLPIFNKYKSPATLGKDRLAAVIAAKAKFPQENILVIDLGSCITYDIVNHKEEYLGGAISPGIQMRLKGMHQNTSSLPLLEWDSTSSYEFIGDTTEKALFSGAVNGAIAEVEAMIHKYLKDCEELKVIITGGDSSFFEKKLKNTIFADSNLVLKGLNEILLYNIENY